MGSRSARRLPRSSWSGCGRGRPRPWRTREIGSEDRSGCRARPGSRPLPRPWPAPVPSGRGGRGSLAGPTAAGASGGLPSSAWCAGNCESSDPGAARPAGTASEGPRLPGAPGPGIAPRARYRCSCQSCLEFRRQLAPKPFDGAMEEELDRASALAHDLGDLLDLLVLTELEHHGRPLVTGQLIDGRPDAAAAIAAHDLVIHARRAAGQTGAFLQLHLAVLAAVMVGDRVQRDLVEPGGEGMAGVGVPLDISQRLEEHLRRHILCQGLVSNSGIRKAVNLRQVSILKSPEVICDFLRALNEYRLFMIRHQCTPQRARRRLNGRPPLLVTCCANLPATPRQIKSRQRCRRLRKPVSRAATAVIISPSPTARHPKGDQPPIDPPVRSPGDERDLLSRAALRA